MADPNLPQNATSDPSDSDQGYTPIAPGNDDDEAQDLDAITLDVELELTEEQKTEIVSYLHDVLPNMKPSDDELKKIRTMIAMYEMAARKRTFPYENAPSLASSDIHENLNKWLDVAETAFLSQNVTFNIDREEAAQDEEAIRRMEKTFHRKWFLDSGFSKELRLVLFEAGLMGGSINATREAYEIEPRREKLIIRNPSDLAKETLNLSSAEIDKAKKSISSGTSYITEKDSLKMTNVGPRSYRIDQTKFWYPRNVKNLKDWQIVSEMEVYRKSQLIQMAAMGEIDKEELDKAIEQRKYAYAIHKDKSTGLTEKPKPERLDSDWTQEMESISKMGEGYDDEFYVYRVTMLYNLPTKLDPEGKTRAWIQVFFCPAGNCILGSTFCQDGFPYTIVRYRDVPYKASGVGIGQERFTYNLLDTDLKSYFLAALEQELGAPLLIREGSGLFATAFRAYPGSVTYTQDPERDAKYLPFPEKSRLAVEGMKVVLGSSPASNEGVGYASGRRQQLMMQQEDTQRKARIHAIATDIDVIANKIWKIYRRLYKLNKDDEKVVDWIIPSASIGSKLYILESEMEKEVTWTSVMSATTMTPDQRLQQAMQMYDLFYKNVPVAVNSPRLTIEWLKFLSGFFGYMDPHNQSLLLPQQEDFQQYQQQLGAQGGERPNQGQPGQPPQGGGAPQPQARPAPQQQSQQGPQFKPLDVQKTSMYPQPVVPGLVAQSPNTPFRNPNASR